jgi:tRNA 2-selenouridine synthase
MQKVEHKMLSHETVTIKEALNLPNTIFLDIRSESEYAEDHIPGAVNIPLFDDKERAIVGIIYKEQGIEEAKKIGLKIVGPKLTHIYERVLDFKHKNIVVYCWRGGMRSKSIHKVLKLLGLRIFRIEGGYKSYRRFVNTFFEGPFEFEIVVCHGLTGVGKTEIIKDIKKLHINAVDLEDFAQNRGSVYGNVALPMQPTQKFFESMLFDELWKIRNQKYVIMECESKRIGKVFLPNSVYQAMQVGKHFLIYDTIPNRIQRIIAEYTEFCSNDDVINQLLESTSLLQKRLGKTVVNQLQDMIKAKEFAPVVEYLLINYYDPLYKYPDGPSGEYDLSLFASNRQRAIQSIIDFLENQYTS